MVESVLIIDSVQIINNNFKVVFDILNADPNLINQFDLKGGDLYNHFDS